IPSFALVLAMPYFMQVGDIPRKRFSQFQRPEGGLYAAEVMGEEGFSSNMSLLYHRYAPSAVTQCDLMACAEEELTPNHPLLPRLITTANLQATADPVLDRTVLCGNVDVRVSFMVSERPSSLYRNAVGGELLYVHDGAARLETVFGSIDVARGDYVVIPKAT